MDFAETKRILKIQIEKLAKYENIDFIKACQAMQAAAAQKGNEYVISIIHEIKMESL